MRGKAVCELCAIIRLNTFDGEGKRFDKVIHELGRGIGILFLKCLHKTPSGIFINGRILEELFSNNLTIFQTGRRNCRITIHMLQLNIEKAEILLLCYNLVTTTKQNERSSLL